MPQTQKRLAELLLKANDLPMTAGVYIMKDKNSTVIYVGKSRKLKNRVSQYFQNSRKNYKTEKMVSAAEDFEYILCKNEIEALSLENTLIKKYSPKYLEPSANGYKLTLDGILLSNNILSEFLD